MRRDLVVILVAMSVVSCTSKPTVSGSPSTPASTPTPTHFTPPPLPTAIPLHNPSLPGYQFDTGASGAYPPSYFMASSGSPDAVDLSCRLPVGAAPGAGGFVVLPDKTYVADPRSSVTLPSPSPAMSPAPAPALGQPPSWGLTFDHVVGKWLPVPSRWVSPDGKRYAFPMTSGINVVDANTSAQVHLGVGQLWAVIDVTNDKVYAGLQVSGGLWELPFSGAARQIISTGYWQAVGGDAAYGTATVAVPPNVDTQILRLDLSTGATQPWFEVIGASVSVAALDANGHVLMDVVPHMYEGYVVYLWEVNGLGDAQVLLAGLFNGPPIVDGHGIWFADAYGIYLLSGQTMKWVSTTRAQVAGGCA